MPSSLPTAVPAWIGDEAAAMFGFFHAPAAMDARATGVLIVPPLGYEAICAHGALRRVAEHVAACGYPVLRIDLPGTGDSAGSDREPERVLAWSQGISRAIDALRAHASVARVSIIGLRMGALLALEAAQHRTDVASLCLWAPPARGRVYVRELAALGAFRTNGEAEADLDEVSGFVFSPETRAALTRIDPVAIELSPRTRVLLIPRDDLAEAPDYRASFARLADLSVETLPGYAAAMRDPHEASTPGVLLDGIGAWLEREPPSHPHDAAQATLPPRIAGRLSLGGSAGAGTVAEEPVRFGPDERLFGIVTQPEARTNGVGVLWLNAGAIHRIGMNRNYVTFARELAERGVTSLRFDMSGLGDSPLAKGRSPNVLYSRDGVPDVRHAIDFMERAYGVRHFVLAGLCAGAYAAFHAALADERVASAIVINPQTFDFRSGDSLSIGQRKRKGAARWYRRSATRPESWRKALRGEVDLGRVGSALFDSLVARAASQIEAMKNPEPRSLAGALERLASRGTRLALVYSTDDPGLDHLRDQLGARLRGLGRDPRIALELIEGPDHTFSPISSQRELLDRISTTLARWHGVPTRAPSRPTLGANPTKPNTRSMLSIARRTAKQAAATILPSSWLVVNGPRHERRVALTFDDGPTELTPAYLDVLERFGVRATFFLVGRACERWPRYAAEVAERGHTIGSHGYTHRAFPELGSVDLLAELARTNALLPASGRGRRWVRPPHGRVTPRSLFDCVQAGFSTALWSYDSGDSQIACAREILDGFSRKPPKPGDIILLHEDHRHTLDALPELIEQLRGDGYELCTVDELLGTESRAESRRAELATASVHSNP